LTITP